MIESIVSDHKRDYHNVLHGKESMNEIHSRKRGYFFQYKHSDSVIWCYLL